MRGSIYYQTATLTKLIFRPNSLKVQRIDPDHEAYQCISSFETMNSYRQIWNNFGIYLKDVWKISDFEKVESIYIEDYILSKISDGLSKQYLEKISAALSKLEHALNRFSSIHRQSKKTYDFKKTKNLVIAKIKNRSNIEDHIKNRAYADPLTIIQSLDNPLFKIAASIQLEGGARFKGIHKIKPNQLKGHMIDEVTGQQKGILETKEKGGRVGDVYIALNTYDQLNDILQAHHTIRINYHHYNNALKKACSTLNINFTGNHGFRWNFAKRRMIDYQKAGYSYQESMKRVSHEMKHNRPEITNRYLS